MNVKSFADLEDIMIDVGHDMGLGLYNPSVGLGLYNPSVGLGLYNPGVGHGIDHSNSTDTHASSYDEDLFENESPGKDHQMSPGKDHQMFSQGLRLRSPPDIGGSRSPGPDYSDDYFEADEQKDSVDGEPDDEAKRHLDSEGSEDREDRDMDDDRDDRGIYDMGIEPIGGRYDRYLDTRSASKEEKEEQEEQVESAPPEGRTRYDINNTEYGQRDYRFATDLTNMPRTSHPSQPSRPSHDEDLRRQPNAIRRDAMAGKYLGNKVQFSSVQRVSGDQAKILLHRRRREEEKSEGRIGGEGRGDVVGEGRKKDIIQSLEEMLLIAAERVEVRSAAVSLVASRATRIPVAQVGMTRGRARQIMYSPEEGDVFGIPDFDPDYDCALEMKEGNLMPYPLPYPLSYPLPVPIRAVIADAPSSSSRLITHSSSSANAGKSKGAENPSLQSFCRVVVSPPTKYDIYDSRAGTAPDRMNQGLNEGIDEGMEGMGMEGMGQGGGQGGVSLVGGVPLTGHTETLLNRNIRMTAGPPHPTRTTHTTIAAPTHSMTAVPTHIGVTHMGVTHIGATHRGEGHMGATHIGAAESVLTDIQDRRVDADLLRLGVDRGVLAVRGEEMHCSFVSDLLELCRSRASVCTSVEELAMHRALAEHVRERFLAHGAVASARNSMVATAVEVSLRYAPVGREKGERERGERELDLEPRNARTIQAQDRNVGQGQGVGLNRGLGQIQAGRDGEQTKETRTDKALSSDKVQSNSMKGAKKKKRIKAVTAPI